MSDISEKKFGVPIVVRYEVIQPAAHPRAE
jgi:hypothetical protein